MRDVFAEKEAEIEKQKNTETLSAKHLQRFTLCQQIMENCRNELYSQYPYLDGVFAALPLTLGDEVNTIGTDGWKLCVSPAFLLRAYAENPSEIRKGYLHILFHCLYLHICLDRDHNSFSEEAKRRWNLACDLTVEWLIKEYAVKNVGKENRGKEKYAHVRNNLQNPDNEVDKKNALKLYTEKSSFMDKSEIREHCFDIIDKKRKGGISAEQMDRWLEEGLFPYEMSVLEKCFAFDSHALWAADDHSGQNSLRHKWESLLIQTGDKRGKNRQRGSEQGDQKEKMDALKKGRYDYRKFLKRFAFMREEVELDMESFDYIPYDLGMRMFGNLPFVEPLEYKEVHRMEELVIAIDTSSSCSKETVQRFLDETYSILSEKENFFHKFKVYLIQCDCFLQDIQVLHNEEEWKEYRQNVEIQGRSGTDFRPVFQYVEELRRKRELRDLKALIYFTDGDGIYPEKATEYETAFVFLEKNDYMEQVPKWARKLIAERKNKNEYSGS